MNRIEKELASKGWINTQVNKNISCGSWPEKHIRVTMWDSNNPTNFSRETGAPIGFIYADGDGSTVTEAFEHLKRNIEGGRSKFWPNSYPNPVEQDYKKWKKKAVSTKKKRSKK